MRKSKKTAIIQPVRGCPRCVLSGKTKWLFHGMATGIVIYEDKETEGYDKRLVVTVARPTGHRPFTEQDIKEIRHNLNNVIADKLSDYKIISIDQRDDDPHPFWNINLEKVH